MKRIATLALIASVNGAAQAQSVDVRRDGRVQSLEITGGSTPAILTDPRAWGSNGDGQCTIPSNLPRSQVVSLGAGELHTIAVLADGTLRGWGSNQWGQTNCPAGTFQKALGGINHSVGLRTNGTLVGWGQNTDFELNNVPSGVFTDISVGWRFAIARRSNGTLAGWGINWQGQAAPPAGAFTSFDCGAEFAVGVRADGTLAAWGRGDQFNLLSPPSGTFTKVAAGSYFGVGIRTDGTLAAWGENSVGQTSVPPGQYVAVDCGNDHGVALRTDGVIVSWGDPSAGLITNTPQSPAAFIAAGFGHSLAIINIPTPVPGLLLANNSAYKPISDRWTISSDRRLKTNIQPLSGALDRLLALRGVTFRWLDSKAGGGYTGVEMGLIADEVEQVFPDWVVRDARGYRTLTVSGFEALTAEAVRELRTERTVQIDRQRDALRALRADLARLGASAGN